jgi:hypothetical protein
MLVLDMCDRMLVCVLHGMDFFPRIGRIGLNSAVTTYIPRSENISIVFLFDSTLSERFCTDVSEHCPFRLCVWCKQEESPGRDC